MLEKYNRPLPIRKRETGWEVAIILGDDHHGYILCETLEDAKVVAELRFLHAHFMYNRKADPARVRRCRNMLEKYGWTLDRTLVSRHLYHLEARS